MNTHNSPRKNKNIDLYKKDQKIDILNDELYHKNKEFGQRKRRKIHGRNINLEHDFQEDDYEKLIKGQKKRKLPTSLFKKIFFVVLFFFITTAIVAALSLYHKKETVSHELISMEIVGQPFVDSGEGLDLQVRIQNFNKQKLELPDLVLSYSKDSSRKENEVFLRRSLSDIAYQQKINEEFNIPLFGQEGDVRNIYATLEYRIEGSDSIFKKEVNYSVIIRSTPTQLSINAPKEIVQDQEMQLEVDLSSNTNKLINDLLLKVDYPLGFEFISSNKEAQYSNNIWYFPTIEKDKDKLIIVGRLSGLPGQGQSFHATLGHQNQLQKNIIDTVFNRETHTVDIQKPFVSIKTLVNGNDDSKLHIRGGDRVNINIVYKNNLDVSLSDVQIIARLDGDLYKQDKVRTQQGDYNSNTKRIIWDKGNVEALAFLEPGSSGSVNFSMETKDLVDDKGALIKPQFNIIVDVTASEINGKLREAYAISHKQILANSDISVIAKTLHNDGPFKNNGPIPPEVGKKTEYTITLQIVNSSNDLNDAKIVTFLPPYVTWLGNIAPSIERKKVSYNNNSREISWDLGTVKAGTGIGNINPKQLSFQVDILPSLSHVDENPEITRDIILSGVDAFTGVDLSYKKIPLSTRLSAEPSASGLDGTVVK